MWTNFCASSEASNIYVSIKQVAPVVENASRLLSVGVKMGSKLLKWSWAIEKLLTGKKSYHTKHLMVM